MRSPFTFVCETWVISKGSENITAAWERKILNKICEEVKVNEVWERRTNQKLRELYHDNIIGVIKAQWMRRMGHVR